MILALALKGSRPVVSKQRLLNLAQGSFLGACGIETVGRLAAYAVPVLRACCFKRRTCLRQLWENRLVLVLFIVVLIRFDSLL
jgi:hypothetical protein